MVTGTLSEEIEVKASAAEAWKIYSSLQLADIALKALPDVLQKIDILEGDGGVGTVLNLVFQPGSPGHSYQKEKFTVVDNEKREKLVEVIEGGHIALGFKRYGVRFQIMEKEENSCITKVSVEYEIEEDASDKIAFASAKPFEVVLNAVADILTKPKDT